MNKDMLPTLVLFGLLIWLILTEGDVQAIKPKLIESTTTRKKYES